MKVEIVQRTLNHFARGPWGNLLAFQNNPVEFGYRQMERQRDLFEVRLGPRRVVFAIHPDHLQHILVSRARNYGKDTRGYRMLRNVLGTGLVTSEGDFWKRQRRIAQPAFHRQRIASFSETMVRCTTERFDAVWDQAARTGRSIDVAAELMHITLDVVSEILLSIKSTDRAAELVGEAVPVAVEHVFYRTIHPLSPPEAVPTRRNRRFRRALGQLDQLVEGLIDERRRNLTQADDGPADLLQMLIEARDDAGEGMTDRQLRDEVMTMYLAGHETTAAALAWTLHELTKHPRWLAAVQAEVRRELGGRLPTLDDVPRLDLCQRALAEGMRIHPPVWLFSRRADAADELGGQAIQAGTEIFISPYLTHRHPEFWPEPEVFDPDRFLPENANARAKHAYLPFSLGQRKCIGDQFAKLEAVLILATLLGRYELTADTSRSVEPQLAMTLRPADGIWMFAKQLGERHSSAKASATMWLAPAAG